MKWEDEGIILATSKHGETSAILSILTKEYGLHKGIVRNTSSRKSAPIYQVGNIVEALWSARLFEHLGTFKAELRHSLSIKIIRNKRKLLSLTSLCWMLANTLAERHKEELLYKEFSSFVNLLGSDSEWEIPYIKLELLMLAELGFGLDLSECAANGTKDNLIYVSPKSGRAVSKEAGEPYKDKLLKLPNYLVAGDTGNFNDGLQLAGYFIEKHILKPRNLKLPTQRQMLKI